MPMKFFKDTWNPKINKIYGMKQLQIISIKLKQC